MLLLFVMRMALNVFGFGLSLFPDFSWSVDTTALEYGVSIIRVIAYLLPMDTVGAIFGLLLGLLALRVSMALVHFILEILPF